MHIYTYDIKCLLSITPYFQPHFSYFSNLKSLCSMNRYRILPKTMMSSVNDPDSTRFIDWGRVTNAFNSEHKSHINLNHSLKQDVWKHLAQQVVLQTFLSPLSTSPTLPNSSLHIAQFVCNINRVNDPISCHHLMIYFVFIHCWQHHVLFFGFRIITHHMSVYIIFDYIMGEFTGIRDA